MSTPINNIQPNEVTQAVEAIKTAILQSQQTARRKLPKTTSYK